MAKKRYKYELKGIKEVLSRINKEAEKLKLKSAKGLIEAAIIIRRDMEKTPPKIPVDTGNLRSSWFVTTARKTPRGKTASFKGEDAGKMSSQHSLILSEAKAIATVTKMPLVVMGFTANYAVHVHENLEGKTSVINTKSKSKKKERRPGSGPKFFEAALRRNEKEIIRTLQENTKI